MHVNPTYQKLKDIVDLDVVQWGNTQGDGSVANSTCQHGAPECKTMMIYACNKYTTTADKHIDFIECFDQTLMTDFPKGLPEGTVNTTFAVASLKACAVKQGIDWDALDKCSTSSEGAGYFAKEKALTPAHKGVPFISVNGAPIVYDSATLNLVDTICKAYTGTPPAACKATLESKTGETPDYSYRSRITLA